MVDEIAIDVLIDPAARNYLEVDDELITDILDLVRSDSRNLVLNILNDLYTADVAHLINRMEFSDGEYLFALLPDHLASHVIVELDEQHREHFLKTLSQTKLSAIVGEMPSDDATYIVSELSKEKARGVLGSLEKAGVREVQELLQYDEHTAGGIMQKELIAVQKNDTVKKAIAAVRKFARDHHIDHLSALYVVDENSILVGQVPMAQLVLHTPQRRMYKVMESDVLSVKTDMDQEDVARIFKKYDAVSLPVVGPDGRLAGRITIDDVVDVLVEEHDEDVAKMIGSDAEELESRSPKQIALMRLPWVVITLFIELLAGVVIHKFDQTLSHILLLASFMPIISAISGNTGLQSAAIIVRGLATGHVDLKQWWIPISRQFQTTLIIGATCGLIIGVIGGLWHGGALFGAVVGFSMFISVNISGFVGTTVPMISKSLGFDPAITAGPFETAFQDVVGISIFLAIATVLLEWL